MRCATRELKNARFLRQHAPDALPADSDDGFGTGISQSLLAELHRVPGDRADLTGYGRLAEFLRGGHGLPRPTASVRGPLFSGTVHFAHVTFKTPARSFAMSDADMATILEYAKHAVVPISRYARQYGPNSVEVSPTLIEYTAKLSGSSYTDGDLQAWVNEIVAANSLPQNSCVVVVSPQGVQAHGVGANAGYHGLATIPYTVFGVFAEGLTLDDRADMYAMVVSHELAELVVDPNIDGTNPEVCDPCDLNCGPLHRCYFDSADRYVGSTARLPPPFAYSYYICAIVKPTAAAKCPASSASCDYAPSSARAKVNVKRR